MSATKTVQFSRPYVFEGRADDPYFVGLQHNAMLLRPYRAFLAAVRPKTVLDAGANIGLTVAAAHDAGAQLVIAFEPSPDNYARLRVNVAANAIAAHVHNWAVGERKAVVRFSEQPTGATSYVVGPHTLTSQATIGVPCGPIDRFRRGFPAPVDAIKIDVEGFETEALKGARRLIQTDRPSAYVEFNSWCLVAFANRNPRDLLALFCGLFPYVLMLRGGGGFSAMVDDDDRSAFLHRHMVSNGCVDDLVGTFDPAVRDRLLNQP